MIKNYFKIAWRTLTRQKMYAMINIIGLTVGISVCVVIFLITSYELNHDKFHADKERIYRIVGTKKFKDEPLQYMGYVPSPVPFKVREEVSGFEEVVGFYNYDAKIKIPQYNAEPKEFLPVKEIPSSIIVTEPSYFSLFHYQWLAGNKETALQEPFKVVLTESAGKKYFRDLPLTDILGKTVIYNDSLHLTVSGIVKDWQQNTDFGFTDFISMPTVQKSFLKNNIDLNSWGVWDYYSQTYVKLAPHVSPAQIEAQFPEFVKNNFKGENNNLQLQPLSEIHFNEAYEDGYSRKAHLPTLYALIGIAVFILIIAIVNFINLSTAQSFKRAKEIGVKKVLGGSRFSLNMQFYSEIFFLTAIATILSVILLIPVLNLFESFIPFGVVLHPFRTELWLFLFGVLALVTFLAGFYPARILSRYKPVNCLKGKLYSNGNHGGGLRKALIIFQFTVSIVLIIGALMVGKQMRYMLNTDMGFNKEAIINLSIGRENTPTNKLLLAEKLRQLSSVSSVSLHNESPLSERHGGTSIKSIGSNGTGKEILSSFEFADANYIDLYNIKLLAGRNLHVSDTLAEFLINPTAAKALGFSNPEDALGKPMQVGIGGKTAPVVGIINDFHSQSLHETISPFFITTNINTSRTISVKLAASEKNVGQLKSAIYDVENIWKQVYPNKELNMTFFDESIAALYEKEQKTSQLVDTAMGIAIIISCLGLFGLISFIAQQRKKEIGIRKVLGAGMTHIVFMISKDFMLLVIVALFIAGPIAFYFIRNWLDGFAYRVSISWWVFLMAGLVSLIITFLTIGIQTIKTATANPIKSLRTE